MGRGYEQLSLEERCSIARLQAEGRSIRQIAAALDRTPSTISREVRRNRGREVGYKPGYAQDQAKARRWVGCRLDREPDLRDAVLERLAKGWSPEQVAGRLAREAGRSVISYESIYRFIYAQIARTKDYRWRHYLPRAKSRRGFRGRRGGSTARLIEGRVSVAERPSAAADRTRAGHWEADTVLFARYGQAALAILERRTRIILVTRPRDRTAERVARHLIRLLAPMPSQLRQTVTFDNGSEFAAHGRLRELAINTYFCDPYSPWQKGGVENAIGRLRRLLPRKTDLARVPDKQFKALVSAYNNTPRKCLDFKTPAEAFSEVLHFECESTSPLSRGRAVVC
jgi:transposase, IS30 family